MTLPTLILATALTTPAQADTISVSVQKRSGKALLEHSFVDAEAGAIHLHSRGAWTWTATLERMEYDGSERICVDVQRLHKRKGLEEIGRPCIILENADTPGASVQQEGDKLTIVVHYTR